MRRGSVVATVMLSLSLAAPAGAGVIEVEFSEVDLPNLTLLDGTNFFDPFGLTFEDETFWGIDSRFIGAGVDNRGITTTTGSNNIMTVVFSPEVSSVTIDFLTISSNSFNGTAFNSAGQVLDSFFFDSVGASPAYGSHTFFGLGLIAKVTFNDGTGTIGVGRLTYTQAVDSDDDGVPDDEDACPDSDLSETVVIDGCDSGVANLLFEDGCTMADLIAECADGAVNHGQFVSCITRLTNGWNRAGLITGQEEGRIQRCAAIPGDLDGDGAVGVADLLILLGAWGPCRAHPDACPADLDLDDIVGITDLLILLGNWG